jgi:phosphopantetheinyl transferase
VSVADNGAADSGANPDARVSANLWLVDRRALAGGLDQVEQHTPRLSPADVARAAAYLPQDPERAQLWRAGRIALRLILEQAACDIDGSGAVSRGQPFLLTAHGEPSLPGAPFTFSQSDAGPYLLIGVARAGRIGVDIELPRRFIMSEIRQARVIAAATKLAGAPGAQPGLLQSWTRIEAYAKARGPSLARVLTSLGLIGASDGIEPSLAGRELQTHDLLLPYGLIGSVARPAGMPAPAVQMFALTENAPGQ